MFDYKYSDIKGIEPSELFKNILLDFQSPVSLKTGEVIPSNNREREKEKFTPKIRKESIFQHCKFILTNDKYINLSGSLHEYRHGGTNFNDFTIQEVFEVIADLNEKFNINPFLDHIHNLEFGVNVVLPFEVKTFLNSIISFKGRECEKRFYKGRGNMVKFPFDQYELKIYDKGQQFNLSQSVLRFEIKVTTMNFLHAKGILVKNSTDLLNPLIHLQLGAILKDFCSQLVVHDHKINLNRLKSREKGILKDGQNPRYWIDLKESNPETFKKRLKKYRELISKHGKLKLLETVTDLITKKWSFLTTMNEWTKSEIEKFLNNNRLDTFPEITSSEGKTFPEITDLQKSTFPQNNPSNSVLFPVTIEPIDRRTCQSCGRDISDQKPGSKYCSELRYGKKGKKCRNRGSNPRNNFRRREEKIRKRGLLFETSQFLNFTKTPI